MRPGRFSMAWILGALLLLYCNREEAPDCFQTAGPRIMQEVDLPPFSEIMVYDRVNLYIEQGLEQKVVIRTGKNLLEEVSARVVDNRLILRNENGCNFFREYNVTDVFVTVPDLDWMQNAGNTVIRSIGTLHFEDIWLRSLNQEQEKGVYTNGDFDLDLVSKRVRITGDDFSNFFLRGSTDVLDIFIANGDGRVEAGALSAGTVEIEHRGTNKLIVNPLHTLKGHIRSTGDVIAVNRPPVVDVEVYYTGRLLFR